MAKMATVRPVRQPGALLPRDCGPGLQVMAVPVGVILLGTAWAGQICELVAGASLPRPSPLRGLRKLLVDIILYEEQEQPGFWCPGGSWNPSPSVDTERPCALGHRDNAASSPHPRILNLVISAESPLPRKVPSTGSREEDVDTVGRPSFCPPWGLCLCLVRRPHRLQMSLSRSGAQHTLADRMGPASHTDPALGQVTPFDKQGPPRCHPAPHALRVVLSKSQQLP